MLNLDSFYISQFIYFYNTDSVCALGYQPPSKKPPPRLFCHDHLKSGNCPSPLPPVPLLGKYPLYIVFSSPLLPKSRMFQRTPIILKFSSLTPSHLLKVTEFLVKLSVKRKTFLFTKIFVIKYFRF